MSQGYGAGQEQAQGLCVPRIRSLFSLVFLGPKMNFVRRRPKTPIKPRCYDVPGSQQHRRRTHVPSDAKI